MARIRRSLGVTPGDVQVQEEPIIDPHPRGRKIPLWKRQMEILRERGTTARDIYERDIWFVDAPPQTKAHCHFLWMSDPLWDKRPVLPGFRFDIYQPVTPAVAKELGVSTLTKDRTAEDIPRVGDAFLVWAPKELVLEQDKILLRGANVADQMKATKESLQEKFSGQDQGAIGDVVMAESLQDFEQAEETQRAEAGDTTIGGLAGEG